MEIVLKVVLTMANNFYFIINWADPLASKIMIIMQLPNYVGT